MLGSTWTTRAPRNAIALDARAPGLNLTRTSPGTKSCPEAIAAKSEIKATMVIRRLNILVESRSDGKHAPIVNGEKDTFQSNDGWRVRFADSLSQTDRVVKLI